MAGSSDLVDRHRLHACRATTNSRTPSNSRSRRRRRPQPIQRRLPQRTHEPACAAGVAGTLVVVSTSLQTRAAKQVLEASFCPGGLYVQGGAVIQTNWIDGGPTEIWNGLSLCTPHHDRHHDGEFAIQRTPDGDLRFVRRDGHVLGTLTGGAWKRPRRRAGP